MTTRVTVRPAEDRDRGAILDLATIGQASPAHHCLHLGTNRSDLANDLFGDDVTRFVALDAAAGDRCVGAIGFDRDDDVAWLLGPWSAPDLPPAEGEAVVEALLQAMIAAAEGMRLRQFLPAEASERIELHSRLGFRASPIPIHILRWTPPGDGSGTRPIVDATRVASCRWLGPPTAEGLAEDPAVTDAVRLLHAELFADGATTPEGVVRLSDDNRVLIVLDESDIGGRVLGYARVEREPAAREIQLRYLGVAPIAQRQGIGRRLVAATCEWAAEQDPPFAVGLTVADSNEPAKALYRRCGFAVVHTGCGFARDPE